MSQAVNLTVSWEIKRLQHKKVRSSPYWVLDILHQHTAQLPRNAEETLLPSEQQTLSEIVHKRAEGYGELQGKVIAEIWSRVHRKFRVSRYSQLPRTQLSEAILYMTGMEIRKGQRRQAQTSGKNLPLPTQPIGAAPFQHAGNPRLIGRVDASQHQRVRLLALCPAQ